MNCIQLLLIVLLFKNLNGHVVDSGIIKNYNTAVGTRLDMNATVFTEFVVGATEVVAYGLNCSVEFVSDLSYRAIGQAVFDTAKLLYVMKLED